MREKQSIACRCGHAPRKAALGTSLAVLVGLGLLANAGVAVGQQSIQMAQAPAPTITAPPAPQLVPVPVRNGVIRQRASGPVPLKVIADAGANYVIKLVNAVTAAEVVLFYLSGGSTVQVQLPIGQFYIRGASGSQWYGDKVLFGPNTSYFRMGQKNNTSSEGTKFAFTGGKAYTLTLKGVIDGNVDTSSIPPDQF